MRGSTVFIWLFGTVVWTLGSILNIENNRLGEGLGFAAVAVLFALATAVTGTIFITSRDKEIE